MSIFFCSLVIKLKAMGCAALRALGVTEILESLDEAGIDEAIVLSAGYMFRERSKAEAENDYTAQEVAKSRGRLIGFCGIHPLEDWAETEIERCANALHLRGVKLHPNMQRIDLTNEDHLDRLEKIFTRTDDLAMSVIIDSALWSDDGFKKFLWLAARHPKTNISLAHVFAQDFRRLLILGYARGEGGLGYNIFSDFSATIVFYAESPERDILKWYLKQFGIDYILFGSDSPVFSPKETIEALKKYEFSTDELTKILGDNAVSFLNMH